MNLHFEKGDSPVTGNKENGISFKILELTLKNSYHYIPHEGRSWVTLQVTYRGRTGFRINSWLWDQNMMEIFSKQKFILMQHKQF